MTVLLTGGAGYIGSHTAVEFLEKGYDVVIADNFVNSSPESVKRVEKITGKKVKLYECDVADKSALERVFDENEIDGVVHFAGLKAVGESVREPLMYYRNNLDSTLTLLETMKKYGVHNFIFSSSATVYGTPEKVPVAETAPTGNCTNPYGWTKYMIEQIVKGTAVADKEFSAVLLRYFNPVGAHKSGLIGEMPNG
ncbi:MAG: SDR family NAD(P)-dependent oxidoreductase, partial [Eubacteriales bacterium]